MATRHNPWFSPVSANEPASIDCAVSDELSQAASSGDVAALKACIARGDMLNVTRGRHGETPLHLAVTSGNTEAVQLLIDSGAYVNACDWRENSPMYYAATHPGENDILQDDEDKRIAVIQVLLKAGGDTMAQGGFSGKRPFEQAKILGYARAAQQIETAPTNPLFQKIRSSINTVQPPANIVSLVEDFIWVHWGGATAIWLVRPNRSNMQQCFKPNPELVQQFDGTLASAEAIFRKVQERHAKWWANLSALAPNFK